VAGWIVLAYVEFAFGWYEIAAQKFLFWGTFLCASGRGRTAVRKDRGGAYAGRSPSRLRIKRRSPLQSVFLGFLANSRSLIRQ
jgi:hypothetical protein